MMKLGMAHKKKLGIFHMMRRDIGHQKNLKYKKTNTMFNQMMKLDMAHKKLGFSQEESWYWSPEKSKNKKGQYYV